MNEVFKKFIATVIAHDEPQFLLIATLCALNGQTEHKKNPARVVDKFLFSSQAIKYEKVNDKAS